MNVKQFQSVVILIALLCLFGCKKEDSRVENLMTFAKVYGYVKYFHPSDEAAQIDWNQFSIYGAAQIDKCNTKREIINVLNSLFRPIAPSILFTSQIEDCEVDLNYSPPDNISDYHITYWQHQGVSIGMEKRNQTYVSRRINRKGGDQLFDYEPEFGERIIKEIGDGIFCMIPIAVHCNSQNTFPIADQNELKILNENLGVINYTNPENLFLRLGNIVNVHNVFQHFYPYFDVVEVNWENELRKALSQSFLDNNTIEHLKTLEQLTAPLKDGHISVNTGNDNSFYVPPISWEWIEDRLIITEHYGDLGPIDVGDEVTKINAHSPKQYFDDVYSRISAGTKGWMHYKANLKSLQGDWNSEIFLEINGTDTVTLKRYCHPYSQDATEIISNYDEIEDGIWYLNLDVIEMNTIKKLLPKLSQSKAIICDLRGYPNGNHEFIRHLLVVNDTSDSWMQVPQIVYPDHENVIGYNCYDWMGIMKPTKPYLGDKNIIFIINGMAISYAESFMGFIEGYNLASIIGQPTAGTNGNVNLFKLPGGYKISWTGMKVLKHDGSQHHGIGILPDIYVEKTIQGIKDGRDEFLEKALEISKNETLKHSVNVHTR